MNYNNKRFRVSAVSDNGEVTPSLIFHYKQAGNILTCSYKDQGILAGQILGIVDEEGNINMRYQQVNKEGVLMTGKCLSTPERMEDGKIRLHESWQWTSGDLSKGNSTLEEM